MSATTVMDFCLSEQTRLTDKLKNTDPLSEDYAKGVNTLSSLVFLAMDCRRAEEMTPVCEPPDDEKAPRTEEPTPTAEAPEEEPERNDDDPAVEHPQYTKEFVRGRLSEARINDNVDIAEIIHKLGYPNFSAIPEDKYWRVMAELDGAAEKESA